MVKTRQLTDMNAMNVYTDTGDYFGDIEESVLATNKVFGWRIRATKASYLTKVLGGAKGVIVPHHYVKAIGDIMIIAKGAIPSYEEGSEEGEK